MPMVALLRPLACALLVCWAGLAWTQTPDMTTAPTAPAAGASTANGPDASAPTASAPSELHWSLGLRLKADDLQTPGRLSPHMMIGLRYGRWRIGAVDGDSWHRFGQIKTDSTLTYDWLNTPDWRTSFSASVQNLQNDGSWSALAAGTKTLRGKASIDYVGWSHWSIGLVLLQDMMGRGGGTALSPSLTWRQALSDDSTLLLSQSLTWGSAPLWASTHALNPDTQVRQGAGWGSLDGSITLRQRWKPHWSWYAQAGHSRALGPVYTGATLDRGVWNAQLGVIYFSR